jgi:ElaB/YqjD/DUF883 family membrane-anchored ribosome-binding protein
VHSTNVEPQATKEQQAMSSTDTSPRTGAKKPKSAEEIGEQIDELRSQLQSLTSTITRTAGKQVRSTQESLETAIRNNPFAAIGIAVGIGFLYAKIRR